MNGNTSADNGALVGPNRVRNKMEAILRAAQAEGWTDATLADACGVSARAIKSYRVEGKEPSLSAALSILCVLGQKAINPLLSTIGYVAKPLDEPDALAPMQIVADAFGHFNVIVSAAADNRIDHTEEQATTTAADMLIATVLPLSSAGRAE